MPTCPTCRTRYDDGTAACPKDGASLLPDEAFTGVDADLAPGTIVGEYKIEQKLGEGGFGAVYRARHPLIGKTAAIKVLARELSAKPEIVARFIDEARAVNQIRHKGIVDIFAFGSLPDGRHYFVMELLEGASLDAYLRQRGRIPPGETVTILRGVARAVDAAHQAGIAHRDLKPDNVFLVFDEDGAVHTKLLDFGVAKLLGEQSGRTRTGTPIGTPQYMSPEQSRGVNVDTRTDVYSFGAMAYEMLTGRVPLEGATVMDTLMKQVSEAPQPPSAACADVPAALDAPILRMLDKDAANRPQTLGAAIDELAAAVSSAGLPVAPVSATSITPSLRDGMARTVPATPPISGAPVPRSAESLIGSSAEVAPPKRRTSLWVGASVVAVIGVAGAVAFAEMHRAPPVTPATPATIASASAATTVPPVAASVASAPTSASASPAEVSITIRATPAGAEIFDGARSLGKAPGPFEFPRRAGKAKLTVKAPGYVSTTLEVDTNADAEVPVALAAAPKATATSHISSDLDNGYH